MRHVYGPRPYDTSVWPDSHWRTTVDTPICPPLDDDMTAGAVVIGAGYAGLSAALSLARAGMRTVVLEAGQPGWGASGRNGGFCCMGGAKLSDATLVRRYGRDQAIAFHAFQKDAVAHVGATLETYGIKAERGPDGEICLAHSAAAWTAMRDATEAREALYGDRLRLVPRDGLADEGLSTTAAFGASVAPVGFPLNPMRYVLGLIRAARGAGILVHGDSNVTELYREEGHWRVATPTGSVAAEKVLVATNGYSSEELPPWLEGRTLPVFSTILVTRPVTDDEQRAQGWTSHAMAYDSRTLLHYFRLLPCGRFLFGMRGGLSGSAAAETAVRQEARAHFEAMFPAWSGVETEREWSGLICLTGSFTPYAGPVPGTEGLFAALGWHGNGIAIASLAGHEVGRMMAGHDVRLPAPLSMPPKRFPVPMLRLPMLRLAYAWAAWREGRPGRQTR